MFYTLSPYFSIQEEHCSHYTATYVLRKPLFRKGTSVYARSDGTDAESRRSWD